MTNATLVVLLLAPVPGQMRDEFYQDFRRGAIHPALGQFGPDAARVIQQAPDGLRIALRAKRPELGAVGVTPQFQISGDFEITVGYQLLAAETPDSGLGTGVKIWGQIESVDQQAMTLAHLVRPRGDPQILALMARIDEDDQRVVDQRSHEAVERRGQLRISRVGSELLFSVAEGLSDEFVEIHRTTVDTGDVKTLRISANTHDVPVAVSVCLTDLQIRADRLPVTTSRPAQRSALFVLGWLFVLAIVGAGGFFGWRYYSGQGESVAAGKTSGG